MALLSTNTRFISDSNCICATTLIDIKKIKINQLNFISNPCVDSSIYPRAWRHSAYIFCLLTLRFLDIGHTYTRMTESLQFVCQPR